MRSWILIFTLEFKTLTIDKLEYLDTDHIFKEYFEGELKTDRSRQSHLRKEEYEKSLVIDRENHFEDFDVTGQARHSQRTVYIDSELPQGTLSQTVSYNHVKDIDGFIEAIVKSIKMYSLMVGEKEMNEFISKVRTKSRDTKINEIIS